MSREKKIAIHNPKGNHEKTTKDHQDDIADTRSFMGEGVPGTLDELLEESCKGSFNILRGLG